MPSIEWSLSLISDICSSILVSSPALPCFPHGEMLLAFFSLTLLGQQQEPYMPSTACPLLGAAPRGQDPRFTPSEPVLAQCSWWETMWKCFQTNKWINTVRSVRASAIPGMSQLSSFMQFLSVWNVLCPSSGFLTPPVLSDSFRVNCRLWNVLLVSQSASGETTESHCFGDDYKEKKTMMQHFIYTYIYTHIDICIYVCIHLCWLRT